jgi:hypothetical protein
MPTTLADSYLKTARAKEHLEDLRERIRVFRESEPCGVSREDDLKKRKHIIRFKMKSVPEKVPLIVGDFLYCLRSSLDQLVWALAKTPGSYPSGTQFPIFDHVDAGKFGRYTAGVPTAAVRIIESLQPYNGQNAAAIKSHLLWQLNKLCNIDKHRRIPTDATATTFNFPKFPRKFGPLVHVDHDKEMAVIPLALKSKMTLDPIGTVEIFFGDSYEGVRVDFDRLETIYNFVANRVIPRFARFFK